jgi:hypothetical protein
MLMSLIANPALSQTTDVYPKPISESAEISAPGKMTILSYPKYYKNAQDQLTEVDTTLVPSNDPDWDYEVTTGIWTLKVRGDGTFQARHEGDIFTYRFQSLGYGRGSNYRPFDLGQADWSSMVVLGDTIRWVDVTPNIDVSVRYIHDILKVDVIVKKEKLREIKQAVLNGELDPDDYLTARFDIPQVLITSQAHKGKDTIDVYQERLNIDTQPIEFKKNDKTIHRLRLVESYISDEKGMPIRFVKGNNVLMDKVVIRSAQSWQLRRNEEGIAEMSTNLGDLLDAPDGDLIIDPIMDLTLANGNTIQDTYLDYWNGNGYGSSSMLYVDRGGQSDGDHTLIGFGFTSTDLGLLKGANVTSVKLKLYCSHTDFSYGPGPIRPYRVTQEWNEFSASWTARTSGSNWNQGGGDFSDPDFQGKPLTITTDDRDSWVEFDVTYAFKKHIIEDPDYVEVMGFLLKYVENNYVCVGFNSRDHANNRPELEIEYSFTQFGADAGYGNDNIPNWSIDNRQDAMNDDNLNIIRYFMHCASGDDSDPYGDKFLDFVEAANLNEMEVIPVFGTKEFNSDPDNGPDNYANRVRSMINKVSNYVGTTIKSVELGNEEDAESEFYPAGLVGVVTPEYSYPAGEKFAGYYLNAYYALKEKETKTAWNNDGYPNYTSLNLISGGSIVESKHFSTVDYAGYPGIGVHGKAFVCGFIDQVTSTSISRKSDRYYYIPDTFAFHTYSGNFNPESFLAQDNCENSLITIINVFDDRGFIPNISSTENGFSAVPHNSPTLNSTLAPENRGDNYTQAVYYLRSQLLMKTMKIINGTDYVGGIGWQHHFYFHHPRDAASYVLNQITYVVDTGFHSYDNYPGSSRAIRDVAETLFDTTNELGFQSTNYKLWLPLKSSEESDDQNARFAWCGWKLSDSSYWLAVWRYKINDNFYEVTSNFSLTVDGDFETNCTYSLKQFSITQTEISPTIPIDGFYQIMHTGSAALGSIQNSYNLDCVSGETDISINSVGANPVFLHIQKN